MTKRLMYAMINPEGEYWFGRNKERSKNRAIICLDQDTPDLDCWFRDDEGIPVLVLSPEQYEADLREAFRAGYNDGIGDGHPMARAQGSDKHFDEWWRWEKEERLGKKKEGA